VLQGVEECLPLLLPRFFVHMAPPRNHLILNSAHFVLESNLVLTSHKSKLEVDVGLVAGASGVHC
jgi:hypothetical protein